MWSKYLYISVVSNTRWYCTLDVRQGREWRIRNNEEIGNIIRKKDS